MYVTLGTPAGKTAGPGNKPAVRASLAFGAKPPAGSAGATARRGGLGTSQTRGGAPGTRPLNSSTSTTGEHLIIPSPLL